jgi:hypothetical protein
MAHVIFSTPEYTMRENGWPRKRFPWFGVIIWLKDFHRPAKAVLKPVPSVSTKALTDTQFEALIDPSPNLSLHQKRALTSFQDAVGWTPSMAERIGYIIVANPK